MITFHVVTLFPGAFKSYLGESIIARAIKEKKIKIVFYNPRDFTDDKWARVDRRPYGGGPGMVLEAPAMIKTVQKAIRSAGRRKLTKVIFAAQGKQFDNSMAKKMSGSDILLICGRYEGIDARVKRIFKAEEISVGNYILTGGELPAMIVIDAVSRQIQGVLGNHDSIEERRVASSEVYTRPEVVTYNGKKFRVPKVLLSGNHKNVERWRESKNKHS